MKPSIGRVVHYVSHGTPVQPDGTQVFTSECRAAIITEVQAGLAGRHAVIDHERVGLAVLNPTGMFFHSIATGGCIYDDGSTGSYRGGSWHWPERVEE